MKQNEKSVYVVAMGDGYKYRNTIENKVLQKDLENYIQDKETRNNIKKMNKENYSIWGLSSDSTFKKIATGDITFFTYKNTLIYIAEIEYKFECKELGIALWGETNKWDKKVLFKNVVKIFIPDSKKELVTSCLNRSDINPLKTKNIEKLHKNEYGFREILGIEHNANLQSFIQQKDSYSHIMSRYANYCLLSNFECLIREI